MPKQAYFILLIQLQGLGLGILEQTKTEFNVGEGVKMILFGTACKIFD